MFVQDLMTPNPIHIFPSQSVAEAGNLMEERNVRHLPVLDEDGRLQGLVTRTSLAQALPGMGTGLTRFEFNYLTSSTLVSEVMIKEPMLIGENAAVEQAARVMNENRISSLMVMRKDEMVGIITDTDLFGALLELLGARRAGVRLAVHMPDETGALARITAAIARPGGYISAVGGWYVKDVPNTYGAFMKIENLTKEQVTAAMSTLASVTVVDVRGKEVTN